MLLVILVVEENNSMMSSNHSIPSFFLFIFFFTGLPLFWTSASKRGFQLSDVVRLLSQKTAHLCGLDSLKGSLAPGYDADLVIWDPERQFEVSRKNP